VIKQEQENFPLDIR